MKSSVEDLEISLWKKPTIEVLYEKDRLRRIFEKGIRHYIGFEISGYIHLGTGFVSGAKIVDLQRFGYTEVFMADWHAWINNKLGGDIENIRKVALGYFKHGMKKSIEAMGGDPDKTDFVLASNIYNNDYWSTVIDIAKNTTINRVVRSITIMGRKESESNPLAYLIYPIMQAADIIFQNLNIAHAGIDQRKAHVIALEYAEKKNYDLIALHHQLITNLKLSYETYKKIKEGDKQTAKEELSELKMSKSIPGSAIIIHDEKEKVFTNIREAFCPQGEIEFNPIWEILENLIFRDQENYGIIKILAENNLIDIKSYGMSTLSYQEYEKVKNENKIDWENVYKIFENNYYDLFKIHYKEIEFEIINNKTGEKKVYNKLWELRKDWINKKIHPLDLKEAVAKWLWNKIEPIYKYFNEGPGKKYKEELDNIKITR